MGGFLSILLLITLALLATSPKRYALRRWRPLAVLLSGGWAAVAAGILIGPAGAGLVTDETALNATPLVTAGLGWIGLMIGLQLRRDVLRALPRVATGLTLADAAASVAVFGAVGALGLSLMREGRFDAAWLLGPAALLACAGVGWAQETRSLGVAATDGDTKLALLVRTSGALGAVVAVCGFGLLGTLAARGADGAHELNPAMAAVRLGACAGLGVAVALLARFGLGLAGRRRGEQLVVFLGVVAFVAGVGIQFEVSPIFTAMLVGAVIANLGGVDLRRFERFILKAEHAVATAFALLAGVLLSVDVGAVELGLALALASLRLVTKPVLLRGAATSRAGATAGMPGSSPLVIATVRQAPVAVALAVGFVLVDRTELSARLLTVVVLTGVVADVLPLLTSLVRPRATAPEPEAGAT